MIMHKCFKCGGELEYGPGDREAVCPYCGAFIVIPQVSPDKFNYANQLRMDRKFDLAEAQFHEIITEHPDDSESYWNMLLCKYGIEYVDDYDGSKVPTCNRMSYDSILQDEYLKKALRYASGNNRILYEDQAEEIDRVLKGIIAIAKEEKPYDVFISFKEQNALGGRTEDSVIAQNIYDALTNRGFRVFFSRVTLMDKAGKDYEPVIFAALHSAKMMIVVGTEKDNMEAVWVRNEWSRYRTLMEKDPAGRQMVVVYKDMNPARDFPQEFSMLQKSAVDASENGYLQDLTMSVERVLGSRKKANGPAIDLSDKKLENLLLRGEQELQGLVSASKEGDWSQAASYFNRAIDIDPCCAKAWWGLFRVETRKLTLWDENQDKLTFSPKAAHYRDLALEYANAKERADFEKQLKSYENRFKEAKDKIRAKNEAVLRAARREAQELQRKKEEEEAASRNRKFERSFSKILNETKDGTVYCSPYYERDGSNINQLYELATPEQAEKVDRFLESYQKTADKYKKMEADLSSGRVDQLIQGDPEVIKHKDTLASAHQKHDRLVKKLYNLDTKFLVLCFIAAAAVLIINQFLLPGHPNADKTTMLMYGQGTCVAACLAAGYALSMFALRKPLPGVLLGVLGYFGIQFAVYTKMKAAAPDTPITMILAGILTVGLVVLGIGSLVAVFANFIFTIVGLGITFALASFLDKICNLKLIPKKELYPNLMNFRIPLMVLAAAALVLVILMKLRDSITKSRISGLDAEISETDKLLEKRLGDMADAQLAPYRNQVSEILIDYRRSTIISNNR